MTRDTIRYSIALSRGLLSTVEGGSIGQANSNTKVDVVVWGPFDHGEN